MNSAAKSSWSGNYHGVQTEGVMYLFVRGSEGYFLHAFGQTDVPNEILKSSVRAIDELRLKQ